MIFNDLSRETGSPYRPHISHQVGTSIDARYLGSGGDSNPLNKIPEARRTLWADAVSDPVARATMIAWIVENRTAMNTLFNSGRVSSILVGNVDWNFDPIVKGKFGNGTEIMDPVTNIWIGAYAPANGGVVQPADEHLSHIHIELRSLSKGNGK